MMPFCSSVRCSLTRLGEEAAHNAFFITFGFLYMVDLKFYCIFFFILLAVIQTLQRLQ